MNPYKMFNQIAAVKSFPASLRKKDAETGTRLEVQIENAMTESLQADYPGALLIRFWSFDASKYPTIEPEAGDVLTVWIDGAPRDYQTARNATTARFWDWRYNRPGARKVFYTQFNGAPTSSAPPAGGED